MTASVDLRLDRRPGDTDDVYRRRLAWLGRIRRAADAWHRLNGRSVISKIPAAATADIQRILLLAPNKGLGDAVLYRPAVAAIRRRYPSARLVLVATPVAEAIFQDTGLVDEIVPSRVFEGRAALLRQAFALRARRFDVAVDFIRAFSFPSAVVIALSGARWMVGIDYGKRGPVFNVRVPVEPNDRFADLCDHLAEAAGAPVDPDAAPSLPASPLPRDIDTWLSTDASSVVALHPGARDALDLCDKRWPAAHYAALAAALIARGARVVAVGGADEKESVAPIAAKVGFSPRFLNAVGRTDVRQLTALIGRCALLVGNNSGPVHVAAALGVPTLSFSGGVDLRRWAPAGRGENVLVLRDGRCRTDFCWQCPDKGERCLKPIDPKRVIVEALQLLNAKVSNQ